MVALDLEMNLPVENRLGPASATRSHSLLSFLLSQHWFSHMAFIRLTSVSFLLLWTLGGTGQVLIILGWGLEVGR